MNIQKVLIVDDDPNIRMIAQTSLECLTEWTIVMATNGSEALVVAAKEQPDVILMDMRMPGMDGLTALSKLREQPETISTPVIFLTANVQTQEVQAYIKDGAKGVISKPFDPMTLPSEIMAMF